MRARARAVAATEPSQSVVRLALKSRALLPCGVFSPFCRENSLWSLNNIAMHSETTRHIWQDYSDCKKDHENHGCTACLQWGTKHAFWSGPMLDKTEMSLTSKFQT